MDFDWDEDKNTRNIAKHKVGFDKAKEVFEDKNRLDVESPQKNEMRYLTIGKIVNLVYAVVYTFRNTVIRIISARRASKKERARYYRQNKEENGITR